jgi:hypothetical protein
MTAVVLAALLPISVQAATVSGVKEAMPSTKLNSQAVPPLTSKIISAKGMTLQQIQALPANAILENNGKKFTKAELMEQLEKTRSAARQKAVSQKSNIAQANRQYIQKQKLMVEAGNTQVKAAAASFRKDVMLKADTHPNPTITELKGTLTPGGWIALKGSGFGTTKGIVSFETAPGKPQLLQIDQWYDEGVVAIVPAEITGVSDRQTPVGLKTAGGKTAQVTGSFVATRETIAVPANLITVDTCSKKATLHNSCKVDGWMATGEHFNLPGDPSTNDVDTFRGSELKNGWKLTSCGGLSSTSNVSCQASSSIFNCSWRDGAYSGVLCAEGPAGVPMQ